MECEILEEVETGQAMSVTSLGARVLAVTVIALLSIVGPASANGLTVSVAAGISGPYAYQVGVGPFSPLRPELLVGVTLAVDETPVTDAEVTFTISVDDSPEQLGPLAAATTPIHLATYEVSLELPRLARDYISFTIAVVSPHGPATIEAEMIVPYVDGTSSSDSTVGARGVRLVYPGLLALGAIAAAALAGWGIAALRRRTATQCRP